jgi:hypothetical protein
MSGTSRARVAGAVVVVACVAIAAAASWSTVATPMNVTVIGISGVALLAALLGRPEVPPRAVLLVAACIALVPMLWRPPNGQATFNAWYGPVTPLAVAGILLAAACPWTRLSQRAVLVAGLVVAGASMGLVVAGSLEPRIDVWQIFQQSSQGLFHGRNPYEMVFGGVPVGQTNDCFNYLPATFLLTSVGWALTGETRWAELAVLMVGWVSVVLLVLARAPRVALPGVASRRGAVGVLLMAMFLPGALRVAQTGWNESLTLGLILIGFALVASGRAGWAILALALAVATKQHIVLMLPLWALWPAFGWRRAFVTFAAASAIVLPWFLMAPSRFMTCTVTFFIDLPARSDSLSLYLHVPHAVALVAQLALISAVYVVAVRFGVRGIGPALMTSGALLVAFSLFNKQSFENQWWFAGTLILTGLALSTLVGDIDEEAADTDDDSAATAVSVPLGTVK